jgi:molybdopterin/thiamine biosynthesis adenylyltransferase|uniref:Molybdopterin-synthase adenylyltransferase n=1 Tax=Desulfobacca acetoxidans TaxID=60893 RepID=A0A7C3SJI5_9BACT
MDCWGNIPKNAELSAEECQRYARQLLLPEVGRSGQARLRAARVTVVGAGGVGSAALFYLAAAGVGHIRVVDSDRVELSNLQRQILHRITDLGRPKAESARDTIISLNPCCQVEIFAARLEAANIGEAIPPADVVLDASDNFQTRYAVADYCWLTGIPLVSAAAAEFAGLLLIVDPAQGSPCYRCLMPEPPEDRLQGILGSVAGVMGCLQATETLKLLLGHGSELARKLLSYDALKCRFHIMPRRQAADCPLCAGYALGLTS